MRTSSRSTSKFASTFAATPSPSRSKPNNRCSGPMYLCPKLRASVKACSKTRFALGVKGISLGTGRLPRPIIFSTSLRAFWSVTPSSVSTFAATPVPSPINPSRICSVPTKLCPRRRASSWASITALMALSVNCSNITGFLYRAVRELAEMIATLYINFYVVCSSNVSLSGASPQW